MIKFVKEFDAVDPGISIDKGNKVLYLVFATYKHRWCFRFRYQACKKKFLFKMTHWTLDDDIHAYLFQHSLTKEHLELRK